MKDWFINNKKGVVVSMFLIPIFLVATISIAHVIDWYAMANPIKWAIFLSIGIEVAALSALAGYSVKLGKAIWIPFIIVTFIQFIGNVFFSYSYIDITTKHFQSWVELSSPVFEMIFGIESTDIMGHKRALALLSGGLLPVISLTFFHFLITFGDREDETVAEVVINKKKVETIKEPIKIVEKPSISEVKVEIKPMIPEAKEEIKVVEPVSLINEKTDVDDDNFTYSENIPRNYATGAISEPIVSPTIITPLPKEEINEVTVEPVDPSRIDEIGKRKVLVYKKIDENGNRERKTQITRI